MRISGEQVHALLQKHGDFSKVEVHLEKTKTTSESNTVLGGYVNEAFLSKMHGWDEQLGSLHAHAQSTCSRIHAWP